LPPSPSGSLFGGSVSATAEQPARVGRLPEGPNSLRRSPHAKAAKEPETTRYAIF
jgi:hypothetical protein